MENKLFFSTSSFATILIVSSNSPSKVKEISPSFCPFFIGADIASSKFNICSTFLSLPFFNKVPQSSSRTASTVSFIPLFTLTALTKSPFLPNSLYEKGS